MRALSSRPNIYAHAATGTKVEASVVCVLMPAAKWQGHDHEVSYVWRFLFRHHAEPCGRRCFHHGCSCHWSGPRGLCALCPVKDRSGGLAKGQSFICRKETFVCAEEISAACALLTEAMQGRVPLRQRLHLRAAAIVGLFLLLSVQLVSRQVLVWLRRSRPMIRLTKA